MKYEVYKDANDILIKKGKQKLVILLSKMQAYIMTQNGSIKLLDEQNVRNFFSALETPTLETGVQWLPSIAKSIEDVRDFLYVINSFDVIKPLIDKGLFTAIGFHASCNESYNTRYTARCNRTRPNNPALFADIALTLVEYIDKDILALLVGERLTGYKAPIVQWLTPAEGRDMKMAYNILWHYNEIMAFYSVFGHSGGRGMIRALMDDKTILELPEGNIMSEIIPGRENRYGLKWERIAEYLTKGRKQQGYTYRFQDFVAEWKDTLVMSHTVNAKVRNGTEVHKVPKAEKYPRTLASMHQHYASIISAYRNRNEKSLYETRKMELADYAYKTKDGKYFFRLPDSDEDMINEARQQSNCLASYTTSHANGKTTIVFMRYTSTPDDSLVTIERRGDDILQKYRAFNQKVSPEEDKAIAEWVKATNEEARFKKRVEQEVERRLKEAQNGGTAAPATDVANA